MLSVFRVRDARRTLFGGMFVHDGFTGVLHPAVLRGRPRWPCSSRGTTCSRTRIDHGEYYALMLAATLGMILMAASNDLITVFLGLELDVARALRAGRLPAPRRLDSSEAALKYFLLGAFASGFLLYGIALLYGATGTTNLQPHGGLPRRLAAARRTRCS